MSDITPNTATLHETAALICSWDTCAIAEDHATWLREENPDLSENDAFGRACADADHYAFQWRCLTDFLTAFLQDFASDGRFHAEGSQLGWRKLSGWKDFTARDGETFLRAPAADRMHLHHHTSGRRAPHR